MIIGILGIQGGFARHKDMLRSMGYNTLIVRTAEELKKTNALIIPGGESTTLLNLFDKLQLRDAIQDYNKNAPIMGTCAGLIVLSKKTELTKYNPLGLIDIEVSRNAYGRQKESFICKINLELNLKQIEFEAVFIRAPKIIKYGSECRVLSKYKDDVILIQNDSVLACSFHPELTLDNTIHKFFIKNFT